MPVIIHVPKSEIYLCKSKVALKVYKPYLHFRQDTLWPRQQNKNSLLLLKDLLFMFGPNIHELPGFVHLHWVIQQAVHVDKLHSPLFRVVHHGRDDWQLSHLFFIVLWNMVRESGHSYSNREQSPLFSKPPLWKSAHCLCDLCRLNVFKMM